MNIRVMVIRIFPPKDSEITRKDHDYFAIEFNAAKELDAFSVDVTIFPCYFAVQQHFVNVAGGMPLAIIKLFARKPHALRHCFFQTLSSQQFLSFRYSLITNWNLSY